jgi:hypothetical protein
MWKYVICVISILFMGGHVYPSVFAQSSEDNYILPVILVYPAIWAEKNTVPPTIEINVRGQFQEDDVLDGAEGDEKKALDTESSTKYFEIPKSDVNAGVEIEVCISAARADDYPDLSKCQQATVGEDFNVIPVFLIE